ncbi:MAG: PilZ domain-containing protein [Bryobacteraceae bacterium]
MDRIRSQERRKCQRYLLAFPIRYRVTPRNGPSVTGGGTTCDISPAGLSFLCREALPVGSHIEMVAQWPVNADGRCPLDLKMTGFVIRSSQDAAAVRVTSHKLCADAAPYRAQAQAQAQA